MRINSHPPLAMPLSSSRFCHYNYLNPLIYPLHFFFVFFTHILTMPSSISSATGPLIHLQILDQHLIIIDSYPVAIDLLEKRSGIYSSRAPIPMLRLMGGWDTAQFAFIPYGECVLRDSHVEAETLSLCFLSSLASSHPYWNPTCCILLRR
jgi:hypothetical protein